MKSEAVRVLIVENDAVDAQLNLAELERAGFVVSAEVAATKEELTARLDAGSYDVVLADYRMPGWTGMDALAVLRARGVDIPLILVTGTLGEERAVACLKNGVADFILKTNLTRLPMAVERAIGEARSRDERARAEELIRKLTLAVDQSPASIFITDTNGTIEYVNARFTEITGFSSKEALGKTPRLLKSGTTPAGTYQTLWNRLREGRIWFGEIHNRRKNGELYWDAVTISPIRDPAGGVTHYLAVQEDLTERQRIERDLREREERFRQLAENISEVFFIMEADFRETLYINPAYEKLWCQSCKSLYERPTSFLDPIPERDRSRMLEHIARARAGEDPGPVEFQVSPPNGEPRTVLAHAIPIRNATGEVYRISGVALDITERKRAQEALIARERWLRTLFDTVNLIVLLLDRNGNIEYLNPFALQLTGYPREEVVGHNWFERFLPEEDRATLHEVFLQLIERELHPHYRSAIITKTGERRMIRSHNTVVRDDQGNASGTLSVGEDATEHARLEEQFRQSQKMEAVGQLAGGVAHDFNNLLTVIISCTDLLKGRMARDDEGLSYLQPIGEAAAAAAGLTRQLLAFSRKQVVWPKAVKLEEVVKRAEQLLRRAIGEDVTLLTTLNAEPSTVMIDPIQLEQVIMNLAVNARDAMPQGGTLRIETTAVELDEEYAGTHWPAVPGRFAVLAMSDTGTGMSEAVRARIFEPFYTTKEVGKGTGLGLSTVYGIVKQSNGFIWVYSELGHGTTFKIYLPRVDQVSDALETPPLEVARGGTETILVTEDSAALRDVAREILDTHGYTVLEAANGQAALDLAARHDGPIDLLLTDVVMPQMSGKQLVDRFRQVRPETQILFMSGYANDAMVRHGVLADAIEYLEKPFTLDELVRKVRAVLDARARTGRQPG